MKKTYQLSFQKIRRKTQIKDITSFEIYIKNIFSDLAKRDWNDKEGKGIEKIAFIDYMNLPFIVGEKLFNVLDKNRKGILSQVEFVSGIINLYVGGLEETQKVIFNMLDFDSDGKIIPEDSRLLISFIKNLANPPQKVMKVKPREALTDEENLEEINLIIKNFFNSKSEMTFEEYKHNIENVNSDVFFLFICFLYNNKPFNDSSIKILKLLNKNSHLISSTSSNYMSCSSDDCGNDSKYKIRSPSNAFKSFVLDLVDLDLDEIQRDCAEDSGGELENVDESDDNNLISEGLKTVNLPQMKTNINLNQLKGNKDYLMNAEINKSAMDSSRIKKTYDNYIERVGIKNKEFNGVNFNDNNNSNFCSSKDEENEIKLKPKISDSKKYLNEDGNINENKLVSPDINNNALIRKSMISTSISGNDHVNDKEKLQILSIAAKNSQNAISSRIYNNSSNDVVKSQKIQQLPMPSANNLTTSGVAENCPILNSIVEKVNNENQNFPRIEILNNNYYNNPEHTQNKNSTSIDLSIVSNLKLTLTDNNLYNNDNNILNPNGSEALNGNSSTNNISNVNDEVLITDIVYENYIFKSRNNNKLKKYYIVLIGKDLFYFSNSKKRKLRGMHNLSCTYIFEDENVIKVREEKETQNTSSNSNINPTNANNSKKEKTTVFYYPFKLCFKKKERIYYCPSEEEARMWVTHIRNVTKFRIVKDFYDFGEDLGSGKFGKVKLAINKTSKENCAIKAIEKSKLKGTEVEMVKTEIEIMKFCRHKNIVRLFDHFEDMDNIYLVLEYLSGGNLNFFLSQQQTLLSEERIKSLINQTASGIAYLHNFGIIHRDLKPENTMMSDCSENAFMKIVDFGLSKILGINELSNEAYGTLSYAAPEVIHKNDYNNKIDIWSLGVIMYFLICGYLPFSDKNNNLGKIAEDITKTPIKFDVNIWNAISKDSKDLVMRCLERDRSKRLDIVEFLQHAWFKK